MRKRRTGPVRAIGGPGRTRRYQDNADCKVENEVARTVRRGTAVVQPPLPPEPPGLPDPRAGLGGLRPESIERLEALGEQLDGGKPDIRRIRQDNRPIAGTRLTRDYQGIAHCVTVLHDRYEWEGRPYTFPIGNRPGHHRHALERLGVLRAEEPAGPGMSRRSLDRGERAQVRRWQSESSGARSTLGKSTEEGLDQAFNTLDAQRDACEAYVTSQRAEGWVLVPDRYDDGRFSGATLERPALQRLLADIEAGRVDVVAVYKIDRLSRALMDSPNWSRCSISTA